MTEYRFFHNDPTKSEETMASECLKLFESGRITKEQYEELTKEIRCPEVPLSEEDFNFLAEFNPNC